MPIKAVQDCQLKPTKLSHQGLLHAKATSLRATLSASLLLLLGLLASSPALELTWGLNGAGGSGSWDTTTANWWDGASNVTWPDSGDAVFAGTGGTVSAFVFGPVVSSMTFNSPGYAIQSGWIKSGINGLTITTNEDATIGSTLSNSEIAGDFLVKTGTAALTVVGTNFLSSLRINQGEFRVAATSSLFFSDVSLADAPGVTVTLGQTSTSASMGSLSGGGTQGGIVQPDAQARLVTLSVSSSGNFAGMLQDNGPGQLGFSLTSSSGTQVFTSPNTYSGATTVTFGGLTLTGSGSIRNSAVTLSSLGTLSLDNSNTVDANRLSDSATLTMDIGRFQITGNSTEPTEELVGNLTIKGASSITVVQPGDAATLLTFSSFTRTGHATLSVTGSGVFLPGIVNGGTGIISPFVTAGKDWATVSANGRIAAFTSYATDINAASTGDHVKIATSGTTTMTSPATLASLNLDNNSTTQLLELGSNDFGLSSGGILSSGSGASVIQNGHLFTTGSEWVVTANNKLTISSPIHETGSLTALTKSGTGTLVLAGANTYAGTTAINSGTLMVSSDGNLGTGTTIEFGGGTLLAGASFISSKGLSRTTSRVGTIDTAGFDVEFSGPNTGALTKTGKGTLTLSNLNTGSTYLTNGILVLPNAGSGSTNMRGGILQVSGTLSRLSASGNCILDIGGAGAARLVTNLDTFSSDFKLTINFGIGSGGSDQLSLTNSFSSFMLAAGAFQFEFFNLGGVVTGIDYPLITFPSSSPSSTSAFAFAPDMAAAGWGGTFKSTGTSISVNFSSVPEPNSMVLLLLAGPGWLLCRRIIRRR